MSWSGGRFGAAAECVLAPNPGIMTLDGTNTWILRGEDASASIVTISICGGTASSGKSAA